MSLSETSLYPYSMDVLCLLINKFAQISETKYAYTGSEGVSPMYSPYDINLQNTAEENEMLYFYIVFVSMHCHKFSFSFSVPAGARP